MKFRNGSVGFEFLKSFDLCCYFCDVLIFEGDAFFPELNVNEWKETAKTEGSVDDKNKYAHTFHTYEKIA